MPCRQGSPGGDGEGKGAQTTLAWAPLPVPSPHVETGSDCKHSGRAEASLGAAAPFGGRGKMQRERETSPPLRPHARSRAASQSCRTGQNARLRVHEQLPCERQRRRPRAAWPACATSVKIPAMTQTFPFILVLVSSFWKKVVRTRDSRACSSQHPVPCRPPSPQGPASCGGACYFSQWC